MLPAYAATATGAGVRRARAACSAAASHRRGSTGAVDRRACTAADACVDALRCTDDYASRLWGKRSKPQANAAAAHASAAQRARAAARRATVPIIVPGGHVAPAVIIAATTVATA